MPYYSKVIYAASGSTDKFSVTIDYLEKDDITVTVNGASVLGFAWVTNDLIQLPSTPTAGAEVIIHRTTDIDEPKIDYTDGSTLTEVDLDTSHRQEIFAIQELHEGLAELQDLINAVEVGSGNLPTVTIADNNSIMMVVAGVWTLFPTTTVTVVTNVQVDGTSMLLQKKTRSIRVISADAESAWTTFHTGNAC
jgi:hypothetical protein